MMKKILWIDDNQDLMDRSDLFFRKNGFHILKASNTSLALSMLRNEKVDGVLLDVHLRGGENGMELLEEIHRLYPTMKIAVFTGYPGYVDQLNSVEQGASAYLAKINKSFPLDPKKQAEFFLALHKLFPGYVTDHEAVSTSAPKVQAPANMLWSRGLFFLLLFVIVFIGVGLLSINAINHYPWILPIVLIASILLVVVVGLFVLRTQGEAGLSQKNFLTAILDTLKLTSLIGKQSNNPDRNKEE